MLVEVYGVLSRKLNITGMLGYCELETACLIHHLPIDKATKLLSREDSVTIGNITLVRAKEIE